MILYNRIEDIHSEGRYNYSHLFSVGMIQTRRIFDNVQLSTLPWIFTAFILQKTLESLPIILLKRNFQYQNIICNVSIFKICSLYSTKWKETIENWTKMLKQFIIKLKIIIKKLESSLALCTHALCNWIYDCLQYYLSIEIDNGWPIFDNSFILFIVLNNFPFKGDY